MMDYKQQEEANPFLPKLLLVTVFITAIENKPAQACSVSQSQFPQKQRSFSQGLPSSRAFCLYS
ncbi:hypothetical protein ACQP3C_28740, partial [Escherichia coli]